MKICPICSNAVDDGALFCNKCGNRFDAQNNAQQPYNYGMNQPQQQQAPQYQQPMQQNQTPYQQPMPQYQQQYQPVTPQNQPKKKNTGLIIGIIVAAVIILAIIGSVAQKMFQDKGYGQTDNNDFTYDDYTSSSDSTPKKEYEYTKGSVVDGFYVNEWANVKFDTAGSWTQGTTDEYAAFESDGRTECGLILKDEAATKQFVIGFEKLTGLNLAITEETYLDNVTDGMEEQYGESGLSCTISEYSNVTVANETYKKATVSFEGISMVQEFYVRKHDGYVVFMMVLASDNANASAIINNVSAIG